MEYGLGLPTTRARASSELIAAAAEAAGRFGYSTVWATDHLLVGGSLAAEFGRVYEAIVSLAYVAASQPRVRLGTSVIVVPLRGGVELAKQIATLDSLSGGRVIVGVGVGRHESEFANVGVGDRFRVRGAYLDETIRLWRHLWSGSTDPFDGRFYSLRDFAFEPLPPQGAQLPIWIGGSSRAALTRAGAVGDGYQSVPKSPEDYAGLVPTIAEAAASAGRPTPILSVRTRVFLEDDEEPSDAAAERPAAPAGAPGTWTPRRFALRGSPEQVAAEIGAYAALGVRHLALDLPGRDPESFTRAAERFMREVVPLVPSSEDGGE